jgi:hypothetical protein
MVMSPTLPIVIFYMFHFNKFIKNKLEYLNVSGEFWTSGMDRGDPGKWTWCSSRSAFKIEDARWEQGFPNENGDCVFIKNPIGPEENMRLVNADCNAEKFFLCDVLQFGDVPMSKQFECMKLWDVVTCNTKSCF